MTAESVTQSVSYLSEVRTKDGISVFDHLASVVRKVRRMAHRRLQRR